LGPLLVFLAGPLLSLAAGLPPADLAPRAERNFQSARAKHWADTNHVQSAWEFGRACFDWAEFARTDPRREAIAREGIAACRQALRRDSNSAPAHYYLAFNLGQLARTRLLGALKLVDEMEREFLSAIALDPKFDYAGPHRSLGTLYFEAPGWPASIGNKGKARRHLEKAVELAPDFPGNRLMLLEAYVRWGEHAQVMNQLLTVSDLLTAARQQLTGDAWAWDWIQWERQWEQIKSRTLTQPGGRGSKK
jgi:tetratricopeptide (TPR) repeat protein